MSWVSYFSISAVHSYFKLQSFARNQRSFARSQRVTHRIHSITVYWLFYFMCHAHRSIQPTCTNKKKWSKKNTVQCNAVILVCQTWTWFLTFIFRKTSERFLQIMYLNKTQWPLTFISHIRLWTVVVFYQTTCSYFRPCTQGTTEYCTVAYLERYSDRSFYYILLYYIIISNQWAQLILSWSLFCQCLVFIDDYHSSLLCFEDHFFILLYIKLNCYIG